MRLFDTGAYVFMYLEEEREELARLDKEAATLVIFPVKNITDSPVEIICKKQTKSVSVSLCVQLCNGLPRL